MRPTVLERAFNQRCTATLCLENLFGGMRSAHATLRLLQTRRRCLVQVLASSLSSRLDQENDPQGNPPASTRLRRIAWTPHQPPLRRQRHPSVSATSRQRRKRQPPAACSERLDRLTRKARCSSIRRRKRRSSRPILTSSIPQLSLMDFVCHGVRPRLRRAVEAAIKIWEGR